MSATVKASSSGLERVDKIRRKKGWSKTERAWGDLAHTSTATLKRFWAGAAIQSAAFRDICKAVGLDDWESIIEFSDEDDFHQDFSSKRLSFAITGSIEKMDKGKLEAITALLHQLGGDVTIQIVNVEEG